MRPATPPGSMFAGGNPAVGMDGRSMACDGSRGRKMGCDCAHSSGPQHAMGPDGSAAGSISGHSSAPTCSIGQDDTHVAGIQATIKQMEAALHDQAAVPAAATPPSHHQTMRAREAAGSGGSHQDSQPTSGLDTAHPSPQSTAMRGEGARACGSGSAAGGSGSGSKVSSEGSTIFVGNLPEDLADIVQLSGHFKKFGQIVNVQVRPEQRHAFIQFRNRLQALAAVDSNESVLGNPRINVAWARNKGGDRGVRPLPASRASGKDVQTSRGLRAQASQPATVPEHRGEGRAAAVNEACAGNVKAANVAGTKNPARSSLKTTKPPAAQLKAQEATIQAQISEQKALLAKLSTMKTASKEEREGIKAQLKEKVATVQASLAQQRAAQGSSSTPDKVPPPASISS
jgi:hypothetical protein